MFSGTLGTPPTVAILDNLSRELARDSDRHMKAVNNLVDSHHYVDALERLNEALLIGEFMPAVNTFPYEKKQKLYAFKRDVEKLFELMNGKDYEEALTLVENLKKTSRDSARAVRNPPSAPPCSPVTPISPRARKPSPEVTGPSWRNA